MKNQIQIQSFTVANISKATSTTFKAYENVLKIKRFSDV